MKAQDFMFTQVLMVRLAAETCKLPVESVPEALVAARGSMAKLSDEYTRTKATTLCDLTEKLAPHFIAIKKVMQDGKFTVDSVLGE
jgi:hypothetical protein